MHLVLDLDDTLYLERDFVRSGFRAVEQETRIDGFFDAAWRIFEQGGRGDIFDRALARLGASADVPRLVALYRAHRPSIRLAADAGALLDRWEGPLGLISDGPAATQRSKLGALGIGDRFRSKILTGDWGAEFYKPHPRAFIETERRLGAGAYVYIADNPAKDFEAPKRLGWRTIRIQREKGLYAEVEGVEADFVVRTLDGIERVLG